MASRHSFSLLVLLTRMPILTRMERRRFFLVRRWRRRVVMMLGLRLVACLIRKV